LLGAFKAQGDYFYGFESFIAHLVTIGAFGWYAAWK